MTWSHDPDVRLTSHYTVSESPAGTEYQPITSGNFEDQSKVLGNFEEGGGGPKIVN